eukprot:15236387-Alexandrium_andersonii.AAC.1
MVDKRFKCPSLLPIQPSVGPKGLWRWPMPSARYTTASGNLVCARPTDTVRGVANSEGAQAKARTSLGMSFALFSATQQRAGKAAQPFSWTLRARSTLPCARSSFRPPRQMACWPRSRPR